MTNRSQPASLEKLNRRQFGGGLAASGIVASLVGVASPAHAQRDVGVARLMAKTDLPDITIGNKDAKVTLIEYASMTCPACAAFHRVVMPKLKEKYIKTGKVLLIVREFPLDQLALTVSMIARCAGDNDKTAALIDVFFERQPKWRVRGNVVPKLLEISKQAGFTEETFNKCFEDEKLYSNIVKQRDVASKEFGVNRTPSFFVNGKALRGNTMSMDTFAAAIDPLLKENG